MIDVECDAQNLRVRGKNWASRAALAGDAHGKGDVVISRSAIAGSTFKAAGMLINGNLVVTTTDGHIYQMHFRKKQQDDFQRLAKELAGAHPIQDLSPRAPVIVSRALSGSSSGAPFHVVADSRIAVVGESHYQKALRRAVGGNHSDAGLPVEASLVREPTNKYDRNAVRVDVDGETVGYIARDEAPLMQERLALLERQGRRPVCQARVFGGGPGKPSYGVVLQAGYALNGFSNRMPTGAQVVLEASSMTTVTGEELHQPTLELYAPRDRDALSYVFATLGLCDITKGKYKGQRTIEVRVDEQRVGQLTFAMAQRYRLTVEAGLTAGHLVVATAVLRREDKIEVSLLMPGHS